MILVGCLGASCFTQTSSTKDEGAIRRVLSFYADARDHHDVKAEVLAYEEDADFWLFGSDAAHGRAAIERSLTVASPNYRFSLTVGSLRLIGPDTAVADASIIAGPEGHQINMFGTYIMKKRNGEWHIAAARVGSPYSPGRHRASRNGNALFSKSSPLPHPEAVEFLITMHARVAGSS